MIPEDQENCILLGTFPFRGSIMSCRLICQYIGLKYRDILFDPRTWEQFKAKQAAHWMYKQLPFLKDGDFVLTNVFAISGYIAEKGSRMDLLGNNLEEQSAINAFFGHLNLVQGVMSLQCQMKKMSEVQKQQGRKKYWRQKFQPYFNKCQLIAHQKWFLSHITIADFFIHENYNLLSKLYPQEMQKFKNIAKIAKNVGQLKEVKTYQESSKAIKQICPNRYLANFMKECKQSSCSRAKQSFCNKMQCQ